jgi:hypothetical protein
VKLVVEIADDGGEVAAFRDTHVPVLALGAEKLARS